MKIFYTLAIILLFSTFAESQSRTSTTYTPDAMLKFYPNPATTQISFDFERGYDKNYSLQIFNFIGKKVHELSSVSEKNVVYLSNFFRGYYIFQLRDKTGKIVESGRFQVVK